MKPRKRVDAGWVNVQDLPKGPNGRALCRLCATETKPPRKTFCSDACVETWKLQSNPGHARKRVWQRDRGVCADCGINTVQHLPERLLRRNSRPRGLWHADHILPVSKGGGLCGLENLRTLCIPCHKLRTRALRKELAAARAGSTT